jgi:multicomponent Na+:H+ antiporter subunit D
MEAISSIKPLLTVLVSAAGACLILGTGEKNRNLRETWTLIAAVIKFGLVVSMVPLVLEGKTIEFTIITLAPGLPLQLKVEPFGMLFALLASTLWIATSFYSIGYMRGLNEHAQTRYFFCFAVCLSATMGIAFSANLLTFFIFYEVLTVATYPLVMHMETEEAFLGSRKYLVYTLVAGVIILFAAAMIYRMTGTLDFTPGGFLAGHGTPAILTLLFVLLIMGCGVKAGVMPLHEWLPTAMVAPTPVSALLHAVAVVKAGVFGTLRIILYVFGPGLLQDLGLWVILAYVVSFTIIVSAMIALGQDNLKRRLAFSTINNLAIIILGAVILTKNSIYRRDDSLSQPRLYEDYSLLCGRGYFCKDAQEERQRIGRSGSTDASYFRSIYHSRPWDGRCSSCMRIHKQMVSLFGISRSTTNRLPRCFTDQRHARHRVFCANNL